MSLIELCEYNSKEVEHEYLNNALMQKINFINGRHIDIRICDLCSHPFHMHNGIEIIYLLEGSIKIEMSYSSFVLKKGDFIAINPYEVHSIKGLATSGNHCCLIQVDETVYHASEGILMCDFDICSKNSTPYYLIRDMLEDVVEIYTLYQNFWYEKVTQKIKDIAGS